MNPPSHPILSCAQAGQWEARLFGGDESAEWAAMNRAGRAVARAVLADFEEAGGFPLAGRVLILAGKGHNGGDALIAAGSILEKFPLAQATVVFVFGERQLRPLAWRAWTELAETSSARLSIGAWDGAEKGGYDLSIDGVFGFQFRPPLPPEAKAALRWANSLPVRLRAAVDLPSGLDEAGAFHADFTYATGIVKSPLLDSRNAGRLRYLDLGFFEGESSSRSALAGTDRVLDQSVLRPLSAFRSPYSDKRTYGHVAIFAGSRSYPGTAMMTVRGALRSGAGLVTAFVPGSLAPAFAAQAPEAMWVGWPETEDGGLALEGLHLLRDRMERVSAIAMGPGFTSAAESLALAAEIMKAADRSSIPVILDADCLRPEIANIGKTPRILTPHAGEFARLAGKAALRPYCAKTGATVVLKGPVTRIAAREAPGLKGVSVYHNFFGGPVLARGGSGDILAGMIAGLLAQTPDDPLLAACRGVVWHGRAADLLGRARGAASVEVTQLLDYLPEALRSDYLQ